MATAYGPVANADQYAENLANQRGIQPPSSYDLEKAKITSLQEWFPSGFSDPKTGTQIIEPTQPAPSSGGSSGPDLSNPVKKTEYAQANGYDSWEQMQEAEARKAYESSMGYINEIADKGKALVGDARNRLQGNYNSLQGDIGNIYSGLRGSAENMLTQGNRAVEREGQEVKSEYDNILRQAERSLRDSNIGYGQRFGEGSGMARALGEYATEGVQRTKASAFDTYQRGLGRITDAKMKLQEDFTSTMQNIAATEAKEKNDAWRNFQDRLTQIDQFEFGIEQDRANAVLANISQLKDDLMNISLNAEQFRAQAQETATAYSSQLDTMLNDTTSGVSIIGDETGNSLNQIDAGPASFSVVEPRAMDSMVFQGQTTPREDEENIFSRIGSGLANIF